MNFLITIISIVFFLLIVYFLDEKKEPCFLLIKLFMYGMFAALLSGFIYLHFDPLEYVENLMIPKLLYYLFFVALLEETLKWIGVYYFGYKSKFFDEDYDIILYSIIVSLGFACFENIFYVVSGDYVAALLRFLFAIPAHLCYGAWMGYELLLYKKTAYKKYKYKSILIPILFHGIYDAFLDTTAIWIILLFILYSGLLFFQTTLILEKVIKRDCKLE